MGCLWTFWWDSWWNLELKDNGTRESDLQCYTSVAHNPKNIASKTEEHVHKISIADIMGYMNLYAPIKFIAYTASIFSRFAERER